MLPLHGVFWGLGLLVPGLCPSLTHIRPSGKEPVFCFRGCFAKIFICRFTGRVEGYC